MRVEGVRSAAKCGRTWPPSPTVRPQALNLKGRTDAPEVGAVGGDLGFGTGGICESIGESSHLPQGLAYHLRLRWVPLLACPAVAPSVRSDRIHAVLDLFTLSRPDESGHYE